MGQATEETGQRCQHGIRGRCVVCENDELLRRLDRHRIARVLRDWIHETPMSQCNASVDECPDWDLAYEVADKILAER